MKKKLFIGLGAVASTGVTIAATVSCSLTASTERKQYELSNETKEFEVDLTKTDSPIISLTNVFNFTGEAEEMFIIMSAPHLKHKLKITFKLSDKEEENKVLELDTKDLNLANKEVVKEFVGNKVKEFIVANQDVQTALDSVVSKHTQGVYANWKAFESRITATPERQVVDGEKSISITEDQYVKATTTTEGLPAIQKLIYDTTGYYDEVVMMSSSAFVMSGHAEYANWSILSIPKTVIVNVTKRDGTQVQGKAEFTHISDPVIKGNMFQEYSLRPVYDSILTAASFAINPPVPDSEVQKLIDNA